MRLELISFKLCPYVQRSVILLNEKKLPYEIRYIDLANKPDWFLDISPMGKVPVLRVGDEVLFESAVVAEYLDETNPPRLLPSDPLQRAKSRAWIEFSSDLLMVQYRMMMATDPETLSKENDLLRGRLAQLEKQLSGDAPYFNGESFSLVDAAFAPGWMRLQLLDNVYGLALFKDCPKVENWSLELMKLPSVRSSVVEDFAELFFGMLKERGSYLVQ